MTGGDERGSEAEPRVSAPGESWEDVGQRLLRSELAQRRDELESALYEVEQALWDGEGVTPEDVHALRVALNQARERVETDLAPVAGVEPWGDPLPRIPMGVLWERTDHPSADGVDPREYIDEEGADE